MTKNWEGDDDDRSFATAQETNSYVTSPDKRYRNTKQESFYDVNSAGSDDSVKFGVRASRQWDVKIPPSRKVSLGGHYMPSITSTLSFGLRKRSRRISIEIQHPLPSSRASSPTKENHANTPETEEEDRSQGTPILFGIFFDGNDASKKSMCSFDMALKDDECIKLKILKPSETKTALKIKTLGRRMNEALHMNSTSDDDDESVTNDSHVNSVSTLGMNGADESPDDRVWIEQHVYDLQDVELSSCMKNTTEIRVSDEVDKRKNSFSNEDKQYNSVANQKKLLQIIFDDDNQAHSFFKLIAHYQNLYEERKIRQEEEKKGQEQRLAEVDNPSSAPLGDVSDTEESIINNFWPSWISSWVF